MIQLAEVTPFLVRESMDHGWMADDELNRQQGFGRGAQGVRRAADLFIETTKSGESLGFYIEGKPVGWVRIEEVDTRTVRVAFFFAPGGSSQTNVDAIIRTVDRLFEVGGESGPYRVESRPLRSNKDTCRALSRAGFHREGELWASVWVGGHPQSTISYVATPPHWRQVRKSDSRRVEHD